MSTHPLPTPETPLVLSERAGGAVRLTLNRGDRFNALSSAMIGALQREVDALAADREARVGRRMAVAALRGLQLPDGLAHAAAAARHRPRPRDRDRGGVPARVDVRP